jgi:hypothetical protein
MAYIALAFVLLSFANLSAVVYRALGGMLTAQTVPLNSTVSVPGTYLAYRAAILSYVQGHPGTSGSVSMGLLGLSAGQVATLSGADNQIVQNGSSVTVETWAPMSDANIAQTVSAALGDVSIGQAENSTWTSPLAGNMGALPIPVAAGNVVSVVTLSGSGY